MIVFTSNNFDGTPYEREAVFKTTSEVESEASCRAAASASTDFRTLFFYLYLHCNPHV